jgi:hypothetical protein
MAGRSWKGVTVACAMNRLTWESILPDAREYDGGRVSGWWRCAPAPPARDGILVTASRSSSSLPVITASYRRQ